MEKRSLGKTGLEVTLLGFGAWAIGGESYGLVEERQAKETLRAYLEAGGNFIDTAKGYGESERRIGEYLQEHKVPRDAVVIATKTPSNTRDELRVDCEQSLRRLQTDYLDLLYLHAPPEDPQQRADALGVLGELKQEGKIRAAGASVKGPDVTQATVDLCRAYIESGQCDALQVVYSIFRQKNEEMFGEAHEAGVGIVARTLLESGFLTGKYERGHRFAEDDHRHRWNGPRLDAILKEAQHLQDDVLPETQCESLSELALRFVFDTPGVDTTIPGGKSPAQVQSNLRALQKPSLPAELRKRLAERFRARGDEFNTNG